MPVVSAKGMLVDAVTHGYAVGAFNITNIIQMEAVIEAAVARGAGDRPDVGDANEVPAARSDRGRLPGSRRISADTRVPASGSL